MNPKNFEKLDEFYTKIKVRRKIQKINRINNGIAMLSEIVMFLEKSESVFLKRKDGIILMRATSFINKRYGSIFLHKHWALHPQNDEIERIISILSKVLENTKVNTLKKEEVDILFNFFSNLEVAIGPTPDTGIGGV